MFPTRPVINGILTSQTSRRRTAQAHQLVFSGTPRVQVGWANHALAAVACQLVPSMAESSAGKSTPVRKLLTPSATTGANPSLLSPIPTVLAPQHVPNGLLPSPEAAQEAVAREQAPNMAVFTARPQLGPLLVITSVTTGIKPSLLRQLGTVVEPAHAAHPGSAVDNVACFSAAGTQGIAPCAPVVTIMCGPGHVGHPVNAIKVLQQCCFLPDNDGSSKTNSKQDLHNGVESVCTKLCPP